MKPWESIIPAKERSLLQTNNQLVVRQCLIDLGYLKKDQPSALKVALIEFRKEAKEELLLSRTQAASKRGLASLEEEQLLKKAMTLEGDLPLILPAQQAEGLAVKIIHYRLQLLGLYPAKKINHPFSYHSIKALRQLGKWTNLASDSVELLRLTGDLNGLIHRIKKHGKLNQTVVTFQFSNTNLPEAIRKEVQLDPGVKENTKNLIKIEKECDQELRKLETLVLDKEAAERQRLIQRNQNKQSRLHRIRHLLKQVNDNQRSLFQARMQERKLLEQKIKANEEGIKQKLEIISGMEETLVNIPNMPGLKAERKIKKQALTQQLKERKKILKDQKKNIETLQKKLKKTIQNQAKEQIIAQKKSADLQKRIRNLRTKVNGLRFRFKAQLQRSLIPSFYKATVKNIFANKQNEYLKSLEKKPYNQFLIRLIQLHQWTNGYYNGRLDSQFAGKTFGAIAEMVEDLPRLRLKYILTSLKKKQQGFWILNISYLIDSFCKINPLDASSPDQEKVITTYLAQQKNNSSSLFNKHTQEIRKSSVNNLQLTSNADRMPRRKYYGRKSLLRSFGRVASRVGQIIFKGIKATFQILENFVLMLYEDLKESLVLFTQSLDFLFGKRRTIPMGSEEKWDAPKYKYNGFLSIEENAEAAQKHFSQAATISTLPTKSIDNTLKILKQVAKYAIALSTGALSWPALVTQLILFCRRWFFRWLKHTLLQRRRELFAV